MIPNPWRYSVRVERLEIIADFETGTYEARLGEMSPIDDSVQSCTPCPDLSERGDEQRSHAIDERTIWPTAGQWLAIARGWFFTFRMLRRAPKYWLAWHSGLSHNGVVTEEQVCRLVAAFHTAATILPGLSRCLPRSVALLHFLGSRGINCRWLFAVRPMPFEAHCWVEWRDVVLTDHVDHVRWFTVFLAAGE